MNLIAFAGSRNCVNRQYAALSGAMVGTKIVGRVGLPEPHNFFVLAWGKKLFTMVCSIANFLL